MNSMHAAVLVVDMQNDFCSKGGFIDRLGLDISPMQRIVPRVRRVVGSAREHGATVVHMKSHFDPVYLLPPMQERLERMGAEPYCVSGTWGAEIIEDLTPEQDDVVIVKHRYSGFYGTSLDAQLRERGVKTVLLAGTATNNCVDGTGRDAFYNGYYVVLASDASAVASPDLHHAALKTAEHAYAVVATVEDIVAIWDNRRPDGLPCPVEQRIL